MADLYLITTFGKRQTAEFSFRLFTALSGRGIACAQPDFSGAMAQGGKSNQELFLEICQGIIKAEKVLFVAQNETADFGALLGFAYALKKEIIVLAEREYYLSFMAGQMKSRILRVDDFQAIGEYVEKLAEMIKE